MAQVKDYVRLWPLAIAAVGIFGFVYAAWQWTRPAPQQVEDDMDPAAPIRDTGPDEHYEKVRPHLVDEFTTYSGVVKAESPITLRAPQGMRVPIVKIHHEQGSFVSKGDVLVTFYKPQIDDAIEKARREGRTDDERRFRGYLEHVELRAPCDGVVLSIDRSEGEVPVDEGIGVITLADKSSYRFVVQVPGDVQRASMEISKKFVVELEGDKGSVAGTVVSYEPPVATDVPVVLALDPHEGIEARLSGTVRVASGRREAGLLPKSAVVKRGEASFVRAWDPESKMIAEKSVLLGAAVGPDVVVLSGVFAGDSVVVPGRKAPE
jgi:multidrug efflux pump subunit AcrA (membrane-fusion protein)